MWPPKWATTCHCARVLVSLCSCSFVMWHSPVSSTSLTWAGFVMFEVVGEVAVAGEMGDVELRGCVSPRSHLFMMWHSPASSTSFTSTEFVMFKVVGDVADEMGDDRRGMTMMQCLVRGVNRTNRRGKT